MKSTFSVKVAAILSLSLTTACGVKPKHGSDGKGVANGGFNGRIVDGSGAANLAGSYLDCGETDESVPAGEPIATNNLLFGCRFRAVDGSKINGYIDRIDVNGTLVSGGLPLTALKANPNSVWHFLVAVPSDKAASLVSFAAIATVDSKTSSFAQKSPDGKSADPGMIVVTSINRSQGPIAGGKVIVLTGRGFTVDDMVKIGGMKCLTPGTTAMVDATHAACVVPAEPAGKVSVTVVNTKTSLTASVANGYEYLSSSSNPCDSVDPAKEFSGGDGSSAASAWLICTADQFLNMANHASGMFFQLGDNLSFDGYTPDLLNKIQLTNTQFDGKGFAAVYFSNTDANYGHVSLFNSLAGGSKVQNLLIPGVNLTVADTSAPLAATVSDSEIANCWASGSITANSNNIGGLVAIVTGKSAVHDSWANVAITSKSSAAGGLVGAAYNGSISFTNVYATGNVSGTSELGGLIGATSGSGDNSAVLAISSAYATGAVTSSGSGHAAGLIGSFEGSNGELDVTSSYASGAVSFSGSQAGDAAERLGGLLGDINAIRLNLSKSWASGSVGGANVRYVGGLVGVVSVSDDSHITQSFASGDVTAYEDAGGLLGWGNQSTNAKLLDLADVYASGSVTAQDSIGGLVGTANDTTVHRAYAAGHITVVPGATTPQSGGLLGTASQNVQDLFDCYWDQTTTGVSTTGGASAGAHGKATADLETQSTFQDWDFSKVWDLPKGSYPKLIGVGI